MSDVEAEVVVCVVCRDYPTYMSVGGHDPTTNEEGINSL